MVKLYQKFMNRKERYPGVIHHDSRGFTLIEMIGVLAVVAVLAAMVLPKVFDVIAESRVNALAASVKAYETAVTKYYGDLGTLLPLNGTGIPTAETTGDSATATSMAARLTLSRSDALVTANGLWPKFRGPYLEKFGTATPPALGTTMYIPATAAVSYGTGASATNLGWDLKGDDGKSDIPTGANVVYYKLAGLSLEDFDRFDSIVDRDVGTTATTKQLRGRAKYDTSTDTLYLYLAHR